MKMLINGKWINKDKKIEVRFPYDNSLREGVRYAIEEMTEIKLCCFMSI